MPEWSVTVERSQVISQAVEAATAEEAREIVNARKSIIDWSVADAGEVWVWDDVDGPY